MECDADRLGALGAAMEVERIDDVDDLHVEARLFPRLADHRGLR